MHWNLGMIYCILDWEIFGNNTKIWMGGIFEDSDLISSRHYKVILLVNVIVIIFFKDYKKYLSYSYNF